LHLSAFDDPQLLVVVTVGRWCLPSSLSNPPMLLLEMAPVRVVGELMVLMASVDVLSNTKLSGEGQAWSHWTVTDGKKISG
jgi:hypothetical protein